MQTIKKYANRKLYHVNRKRYITLEGIATLIQAGEQVQVVDNENGEDITAPILAQVALQPRGERGWLQPTLLTGLIRTGGDTIHGLQRSLWATLGGTSIIDAEIARRLGELRDTGTIDVAEAERLQGLLMRPREDTPAAMDLPSRHDMDRLREQVDALAAEIEKLATERDERQR